MSAATEQEVLTKQEFDFYSSEMKGFELNDKFDKGYFMEEKSLEILSKYICGNLVNYTPNFRYWNEQDSYLNKLYIVIQWRKKNNLIPIGGKGEMICKDQLINFFEDKKHASCCGQV